MAGNLLGHEWPGTAYLMVGLFAISGLVAIVGGAAGFLVALRHFWKTFRAAGRSDISGGR